MLSAISKILMFFICGVLGGIWAQIFLLPYLCEQPFAQDFQFIREFKERKVVIEPKEEIIIRENTALVKAAEKVKKVVVGIKSRTKTGKVLTGSGLIVSSDGLIITLTNIVPQGAEISLFLDNKELSPEILQRKSGFALLKIEETNLPTKSFGRFEDIKLGKRIFLLGAIFRGKEEEEFYVQKIVNQGIVKYFNKDEIHTNIFENYELSGSSLFDIKGNLVGINTIGKEGKVIAIPASEIQKFLGF
jgi:S1-C subfamily serine protease